MPYRTDEALKMTKKILISVAGLIVLAAIGFYVWRVWAQNEEMYHSDCSGYISDDGTVLVYGPDWDREGGKCLPNFYPVWVARKKFGLFGGFKRMLCKMVDSGSSGNFTLETSDRCFRFENDSFCYSEAESGGVIPIYCEIKEDGEMVRHHLNCYGWTFQQE